MNSLQQNSFHLYLGKNFFLNDIKDKAANREQNPNICINLISRIESLLCLKQPNRNYDEKCNRDDDFKGTMLDSYFA